ncbi:MULTISPECIES: hypothetical protein [unclassified Nocardia]|uniref:hypothetical protein n=1 Tax=unclassified Nocardia TaxID=2637762 RepID=UPI001CE3ECD8|nr:MULTISPECIES: hypothetical protein [unclassified Nocardia]
MSVTGVSPAVVKAVRRAVSFAEANGRWWVSIEDLLLAVIATAPLEMWWPRVGQGMLDGGRIADPDVGDRFMELSYRELVELVGVMIPPAPGEDRGRVEPPEVRYTVEGANADQISAWIDENDTAESLAVALYGEYINDPDTPPRPPYFRDIDTAWVRSAHLDEAATYVSTPGMSPVTWRVATRDTVPSAAAKDFRARTPGIIVDELYSAALLAMFAGKLAELGEDASVTAIVWSAKTAGMGYWLPNIAIYSSDHDE